jgi:hypothetical protein
MGVNKVLRESDSIIQPESIIDPIQEIINDRLEQRNEKTTIFEDIKTKNLQISDYLYSVASHIPQTLISNQNLNEIRTLSNNFTGNLTSFLIFESRLNSYNARSDYCFAVSSKNGEREVLKDLIKGKNLPYAFLNQSEWKQLGDFAESWTDTKSILYDSIIGLWFEFDTASTIIDAPTPSIFIQPRSKFMMTGDATSQHTYLTKIALPLLLGRPLVNKVEEKVLECIKMLPLESSLFQIGTMLSRKDDEIRIVIKRIRAEEIIPYLKSIGWSDDQNNSLSNLLEEIKEIVSRIVLHISVGEDVNPKVGIECSFYPDNYHREEGWKSLLNYLLEKGLCNKEKYSSLLKFSGIEPQDYDEYFDPNKCTPAVMISEEEYSSALIRYISHIKLVYEPNNPIEAKAYPAVRLFGHPYESNNHTSKLNREK